MAKRTQPRPYCSLAYASSPHSFRCSIGARNVTCTTPGWRPHRYALSAHELEQHRTDGHMDIDAVRPGAILLCPVKLDGGGGLSRRHHALQGDGEIAGAGANRAMPLPRRIRTSTMSTPGPVGRPGFDLTSASRRR
jgi:acetamidase/formamidase